MTAGTLLHGSKTSPHVWFWAAYLVATQTSGISALELQKQLGLARYETAFQLLHKLRAAMVRPFRDPIGLDWPVEMDVTFVGDKHKAGGSGTTHKLPVVIAVESVDENVGPAARAREILARSDDVKVRSMTPEAARAALAAGRQAARGRGGGQGVGERPVGVRVAEGRAFCGCDSGRFGGGRFGGGLGGGGLGGGGPGSSCVGGRARGLGLGLRPGVAAEQQEREQQRARGHGRG